MGRMCGWAMLRRMRASVVALSSSIAQSRSMLTILMATLEPLHSACHTCGPRLLMGCLWSDWGSAEKQVQGAGIWPEVCSFGC